MKGCLAAKSQDKENIKQNDVGSHLLFTVNTGDLSVTQREVVAKQIYRPPSVLWTEGIVKVKLQSVNT